MEVGSLPQWNGFRKRLRTSPDKRGSLKEWLSFDDKSPYRKLKGRLENELCVLLAGFGADLGASPACNRGNGQARK